MLNLSKRAIYVISLPGWEEVFLKFPTSGGRQRSGGGPGGSRPAGAWRQRLSGDGRWRRGPVSGSMWEER